METSPLPVAVNGRTYIKTVHLEGEEDSVIYRNRAGKFVCCTPAEWEDWCSARGVERPPTGAVVVLADGRTCYVMSSDDDGIDVLAGRPKSLTWPEWAKLSRRVVGPAPEPEPDEKLATVNGIAAGVAYPGAEDVDDGA